MVRTVHLFLSTSSSSIPALYCTLLLDLLQKDPCSASCTLCGLCTSSSSPSPLPLAHHNACFVLLLLLLYFPLTRCQYLPVLCLLQIEPCCSLRVVALLLLPLLLRLHVVFYFLLLPCSSFPCRHSSFPPPINALCPLLPADHPISLLSTTNLYISPPRSPLPSIASCSTHLHQSGSWCSGYWSSLTLTGTGKPVFCAESQLRGRRFDPGCSRLTERKNPIRMLIWGFFIRLLP